MTTTPQTEASRLADRTNEYHGPHAQAMAKELRRLDAENQRQRADLERKSEAIQRLWAERDQLRAQVERLQGGEPVAWRVRRHDAPQYWIVFLHKPVDALQDPDREVQPLYTAQPAAPAV